MTMAVDECRTFRPRIFKPRMFRPGHFGNGHFGHEKKPKGDVSAITITCGLGACMHKCLVHVLGKTFLNNLKYYILPNLY